MCYSLHISVLKYNPNVTVHLSPPKWFEKLCLFQNNNTYQTVYTVAVGTNYWRNIFGIRILTYRKFVLNCDRLLQRLLGLERSFHLVDSIKVSLEWSTQHAKLKRIPIYHSLTTQKIYIYYLDLCDLSQIMTFSIFSPF